MPVGIVVHSFLQRNNIDTLVYQDIIDWLKVNTGRGHNFDNKEDARKFILSAQLGIIYPAQEEALEYYYGLPEIEELGQIEPLDTGFSYTSPLEQIQQFELERLILPEEAYRTEFGIQAPTTPYEIQEEPIRKQNFIQRLFSRLRGQ